MEINIKKSDNQSLLSRCEIIGSKVSVSPLIIPLPEEGEEIKIDYMINNQINNLFTSKDSFFPDIKDKIPIVVDTNNYRIGVFDFFLNDVNSEKIRVYVKKSNKSFRREINSLIYILFFSNIIGVTIAFSFSYFLASYFLRPVNKIIDKTNQINLTNKTDLIDLPETNDEIQMLSETINGMLIRIQESLKMQNNFFASASHELKTPLTILQTEIEVNLQKENLNKEFKLFLLSQLEEVNRLKRLIEDFLTLSQINSGTLKLRINSFELDDLLIEIVNKLNNLLVKAKIKIELKFDENTTNFDICADKDKITTILINLIENAVKYSAGNIVNIYLLKEEKDIYIINIKNYINNPIADIENIKDEFYRSDVLKDGHGMGLWISDKLTKLHSGKLFLNQTDNQFIASLMLNKFIN